MVHSSPRWLLRMVAIIGTVVVANVTDHQTGPINASEENNNLFENFKIQSFSAHVYNSTLVVLRWEISPPEKNNSLGSGRYLNISKYDGFVEGHSTPLMCMHSNSSCVYRNSEPILQNEGSNIVNMSTKHCELNNQNNKAQCNYTLTSDHIQACENYKVVLGGLSNTVNFSTGILTNSHNLSATLIPRSSSLLNLNLDQWNTSVNLIEENCVGKPFQLEMRLFFNNSSESAEYFPCNNVSVGDGISCNIDSEKFNKFTICDKLNFHLDVRPVLTNVLFPWVTSWVTLNVTNLSSLWNRFNQLTNFTTQETDGDIQVTWTWNYFFAKDISSMGLEIYGIQSAFNETIPASCMYHQNVSNSSRTITFNRFNYTCVDSKVHSFKKQLSLCTNYGIEIHNKKLTNKNKNKTFKFPLKPRDIMNLQVYRVSSNHFELSCEIPISCRDMTGISNMIEVVNANKLIKPTANNITTCTSTYCIMILSYTNDITPCTVYDVHLGNNAWSLTTFPEIKNVMVENISAREFQLWWEFPKPCMNLVRDNTLVQVKTIQNYVIRTTNAATCNFYCIERIDVKNISPCTVYTVHAGNKVLKNITTHPEIKNFKVENISTNQFQLSWEFPSTCNKNSVDEMNVFRVWKGNEIINPINKDYNCGAHCIERTTYANNISPCTFYTVYAGNKNIGSLTTYPEIENLKLESKSTSQFQLSWEFPSFCRKLVEDNNLVQVENQMKTINATTKHYNCNGLDCIEYLTYEKEILPCTLYTVLVGNNVRMNLTIYPEIENIEVENISISGFQLSWNFSSVCKKFVEDNYLVQVKNQNETIKEMARNISCSSTSCIERLTYETNISPCTLYTFHADHQVRMGRNVKRNITTHPEIWDGSAKTYQSRNSDNNNVEVLFEWNVPSCKQQFIEWRVKISSDKAVDIDSDRLLEPIHRVNVSTCKTYNYSISAEWNIDRIDWSKNQSLETFCPSISGTIYTALGISLTIALLVAAIFSIIYKRKRFAYQYASSTNMTEKPANVSSNTRNRVSSISRIRIPSLSRQKSGDNPTVDLNTLPHMENRPLNIRQICSFDVNQAKVEFPIIQKLAEAETKGLARDVASRIENKIKNRFVNTHPFDFNRVVLSTFSEDGQDDYINASFIPGFSGNEKEYIAAQGPKENTLNDFWRMIWEQGVRLIAMVTSLNENGRRKCEKYWPDKGETLSFGGLELSLVEETIHSFYTVRIITAVKSAESKRKIRQFHFTAWPDFESPEEPEELIRFIEVVRCQTRKLHIPLPTVVHCSAGVGRTGTLIAIDYLIQQVLITDVIDVPNIVRHLRRFRLSMVQSESQYVFLYACIAHYVKTRLNLNEVSN